MMGHIYRKVALNCDREAHELSATGFPCLEPSCKVFEIQEESRMEAENARGACLPVCGFTETISGWLQVDGTCF